MKNKYDVVIIGAGPAGLECANQLKKSNLSVLLIEKNKIIGPKPCAGGLTQLDAKFDIPVEKTRRFAQQEIVLQGKRYLIYLKNPLRTISRLDLGQYQYNKIKNCSNIEIIKETTVKEVKKDMLITSRGNIYFKYLVGADGSNSIVRKYLNLKAKVCLGMYYNIKKISNNFVWHLNPQKLKTGYLWIFPHKNYTNIGVYFDPDYVSAKQARKVLENFLISKKYNFSKSQFNSAPINYSYQGCVFNNIFLIGDAAGLSSKTTGEGISFALVSGREIGKKILDYNYNLNELKKILKLKKRQERILGLFEHYSFFPSFLFKIFVNLLQTKWFQLYFGN